MKHLTNQEKERWFKYKIPNGTNLQRVKVDVVNFNRANTICHELGKALCALQLMLYGEVTFNEKVVCALRTIETESVRPKHDPHKVITEAQETSNPIRRDIVDLTTGEIWELETDKTRAKRHPININVIYL